MLSSRAVANRGGRLCALVFFVEVRRTTIPRLLEFKKKKKKRHPLAHAAEVDPEPNVSSAIQSEGGERREGDERERGRRGEVGGVVVYVPISPLSSQSSPARGPNGSV